VGLKEQTSHKIIIIHFQPLELYPPVCNLLEYLSKNSANKIIVVTTENDKKKKLRPFISGSANIIIKRAFPISPNSITRFFWYLFFYLNCLRLLLKHQPKSVLYFETISSWPALIYKKMKGDKVRLLVHYHEYISPNEYVNNMQLVKWMNKLECKMYRLHFNWISHTNEMRLKKFINDNHLQKAERSIFWTMPNYPSKQWASEKKELNTSGKTRLVYIGSLGYDSMYLKEIIEWVIRNKSSLSLDFYSNNIDKKAKFFLQSIKNDSITFHGGCNYEDLPTILKSYDVGLVIYKPVSDNWIYNMPNKIFEYLACGLDVWFAKTLISTLSITRDQVYPKILPIDYQNLNNFNYKEKINRVGLCFDQPNFYYENVYAEIYKSLSQS
jgi:hypothetical protein